MKVIISLKLSMKPRVLLIQCVDGITSLTAMRNNNNSNNDYYIIILLYYYYYYDDANNRNLAVDIHEVAVLFHCSKVE